MRHTTLAGWTVAILFSVSCGSGSAPQGSSGAPPATPEQTSSTAQTGNLQTAPAEVSTDRAAPDAPAIAAPVASPAPRFKEITVPAGTSLRLELENTVSSDGSKPDDPVRAKLSRPIVIDEATIVPAGAEVTGAILDAKQSGKVKGRGTVSFRFNRLRIADDVYEIQTARVSRQAEATKREDAKKIGIGAGAGAAIGAIAGGKKGAAIGGAVGAGAGTGVVMATRGEEVRLGPGAAIRTTFTDPVTIRIRVTDH